VSSTQGEKKKEVYPVLKGGKSSITTVSWKKKGEKVEDDSLPVQEKEKKGEKKTRRRPRKRGGEKILEIEENMSIIFNRGEREEKCSAVLPEERGNVI